MSTGTRSPVAFTRETVMGAWPATVSEGQKCINGGCSTKKYSIFRTFMEFCNCYSYRTNSRMSWLLRSWVHNCQTKNGLNPLKIAANVDLTRWKVAEIGRLYVVDRTLSRHSRLRLRPSRCGVTMGPDLDNNIPRHPEYTGCPRKMFPCLKAITPTKITLGK